MKKDFDKWNEEKKEINDEEKFRLYHEREIWWCSLGVNIGFEQDGTGNEFRRPVLILKGLSKETCLVIPLTTSTISHPMRPSVGVVAGKDAKAILSQLRVVDTKRFGLKIGYLDKVYFSAIRKAVKDML